MQFHFNLITSDAKVPKVNTFAQEIDWNGDKGYDAMEAKVETVYCEV